METFDFSPYFKKPIVDIQAVNGGLTNRNYLITTSDGKYFFRLPDQTVDSLFDRQTEELVLKTVLPLGIDLPYQRFFVDSGIKISPYYKGLLTYSQYQGDDKAVLVALTLKKLHSLKTLCGHRFDYEEKLRLYRPVQNYPQFDLNDFTYLLNGYRSYHDQMTICHNDCVDGNLLFQGGKCYLIDYEYAGDNYPIFDLTSFTTENDLDPQQRGDFYRLYYGKIDDKLKDDLQLFEKLHDLLWTNWALYMSENKKDEIYLKIAVAKYHNLVDYQSFVL